MLCRKNKLFMNFITGIYLTLIILVVSQCSLQTPVDENYYAGVDKIAGRNPPSAPTVTFTQSLLRFDFTASIDPDTGGEVGRYYVYSYQGAPTLLYQARDIVLILQSSDVHAFTTYFPSGDYSIVVTGFDGGRESAIIQNQNLIFFKIP